MNTEKKHNSHTVSDDYSSLIPSASLEAFSSDDKGITLGFILSLFVFSEISVREDIKEKSWMQCAPELNKSRTQHNFDNQLQHMLVSCGHIGFFQCNTIPCGNAYSRTKLESEKDSCVLLVFHSYNSESNYLQKFFRLNTNTEKPTFLFLQYDLRSDQQVNRLTLCIPNESGEICKSIDLQSALNGLRNYYQGISSPSQIDAELQKIANYSKMLRKQN